MAATHYARVRGTLLCPTGLPTVKTLAPLLWPGLQRLDAQAPGRLIGVTPSAVS